MSDYDWEPEPGSDLGDDADDPDELLFGDDDEDGPSADLDDPDDEPY